MSRVDFRAVERSDDLASPNALPGGVDMEAVDSSANPGGHVLSRRLVGLDPSQQAYFCRGISLPANHRGSELREGASTLRQHHTIGAGARSGRSRRNQVHATQRTGAGLRGANLGVHRAGPDGFLPGMLCMRISGVSTSREQEGAQEEGSREKARSQETRCEKSCPQEKACRQEERSGITPLTET